MARYVFISQPSGDAREFERNRDQDAVDRSYELMSCAVILDQDTFGQLFRYYSDSIGSGKTPVHSITIPADFA